MKLLNHVVLAAVVAISVGFAGACAEVPAQTTTTTEYSTSAPGPVYVAPPVTTGSSTTTTQYTNGTVTSTTPGYTSVVTNPSVVMAPSSAAAETTKTTVYDDGVVQKKVTTTDYDTYDSTDDPAEPAARVAGGTCRCTTSPEPNNHFYELGKRGHRAEENDYICRRLGTEPDHDDVEWKWKRTVSDHHDHDE